MKVVFVDNMLFEGSADKPRFDLQPHLGLMSLVAVARAHGHEAEIYDPKAALASTGLPLTEAVYDEALACISSIGPDVIGFTALGCNFPYVARLSGLVRETLPNIPIILGGPHASILHSEIMGCLPWIDIIVRHEAEDTLPLVLAGILQWNFDDVAGVTYRSKGGAVKVNAGKPTVLDLNRIPSPAYDAYDIPSRSLTTIRIEAGRGCPFKCSFCSTASFFGREYRLKAATRLADEMNDLNGRFGFVDFKLNHDLFTVNRKKVKEFCAAVLQFGFTWGCSARMDCVDADLLSAMAAAGCRRIYFGIETGSPRLQRLIKKNLNLDLVPAVMEETERLGISTVTSFITGYPEESDDDHRATLDMVATLHCRPAGLNTAQLHVLTPEPGTDLLDQFGRELVFDPEATGFNLPLLCQDEDKLVRLHPDLFGNYFAFPTQVPRHQIKLSAKIFEALCELDRSQVKLILGPFDGSLYVLVSRFSSWWTAKSLISTEVGLKELAEFMSQELPKTDLRASILRHRNAAMEVVGSPSQTGRTNKSPGAPSGDPRGAQLVTSMNMAIVREIHSLHSLQRLVGDSKALHLDGESEKEPFRNYVYLRRSNHSQGVDVVEMDDAALQFLERFDEPASYYDYCLSLETDPEAGYVGWDQVVDLISLGVLEWSPSAP